MLKAKDFRKYAREALAGKWLKAGAVGVLASMLGATIGTNRKDLAALKVLTAVSSTKERSTA